MPLLLKSELRDIRRNSLNAIFVTISLSVGVMSVLVTHQLSLTIIDRLGDSGLDDSYDYVLYLAQQTEDEYFDVRQRWRSGEISGVTHVVPVLEGVLDVDGKVFNVLGYDPIATLPSSGSSDGPLQADLRFLTEDSVIAIGTELREGDQIKDARVVGVAQGRTRQLIADIPTAQRLLDRRGQIDAVWLKTLQQAKPWWDRLVPGLMTATSTSAATLTFEEYEALPFEWWNPSEQLADAIVFNLGMLSLLTLLVAGFIVFQAMQSNIRNRESQVELFDVLGLSQTQQRALILLQCAFFGVVGCCFGVLVGVGLLAFLNDAPLLETWETLDTIGLWKAITLGMLAAAAVGIFVRKRSESTSPYVWTGATAITLCGIAYGFWDQSGLLGASLLSVCFCLLSIFCVTPFAIKCGVVFLRRIRTSSMLQRMNLRNALDTAKDIRLAINALSIAVATAIGIGLMLSSFRVEFTTLLDQRLINDLHLSDAVNFDAQTFALRDDVEAIRTYKRGPARINGIPVQLVATDMDAFERTRYGYEQIDLNGVFINEVAAAKHDFQVGDLISLDLANNLSQPLRILHVFKDHGEPNSRVIAPIELVQADRLVADRFSIDTSRPIDVRAALADQYPAIRVVDNDEIRQVAVQVFNASFATAQIMVNVAIFVAVIGMACALIGMQAKRLKEMRLLNMMGTSRMRLAWNAVVQNGLIGLFAVVVALPLSLAIAWNLCYFVNPRAYGWSFDLALSWQPILMPASLGVIAAICAGLEPMRRALSKVISQPFSNAR